MKNSIFKKGPKLELKGGVYVGGYSSLTQEQLIKLKGGANLSCNNGGDCSKSDNGGFCTNTGTCFTKSTAGSSNF